jgi:hypothetical protein
VLNTDGAGNSEHRYGCGGLIRGSSSENGWVVLQRGWATVA